MKIKNKALLLFVFSFYTFLFLPLAPLWAQALKMPANSDLVAPSIQHDPPTEKIAPGEPVSIQATVTDNNTIKEVLLFYRVQGEDEYLSINMQPKGPTSYTTLIPKEEIRAPGLEYYIQASDQAGNVALRGFSFSPLSVAVAPKAAPNETFTKNVFPKDEKETALKTEVSEGKPWYKKWWVWAIAGVVVVAAAAGGGGGGGGGGGAGGPATGSASVSSPAP